MSDKEDDQSSVFTRAKERKDERQNEELIIRSGSGRKKKKNHNTEAEREKTVFTLTGISKSARFYQSALAEVSTHAV